MVIQNPRCRFFTICFFVLLLAFGLSGCGEQASQEVVVANVNDEEISDQELQDFLKVVYLYMPDVKDMYEEQGALEMLENEILWFLIENRVLEQEVQTLGLDVDEEGIEQEFQETRVELVDQVYGSEEAFQERLNELGIEEQAMRLVHRDSHLRWALFDYTSNQLSDDEVRAFVEENPSLLDQPAQVHAYHILLETENEANSALERLRDGADFIEVGEEVSLDNYVELGLISSNDMMDPTFLEAAFALSSGEISDPVETPFGFHIIKITDKTEAQQLTFEEIQEEAREIKKRHYFEDYLQELMGSAEVETFLDQ